jgi:hypothetical protein
MPHQELSDCHVSVSSWAPAQRHTPLPLRRQVDCYDQRCVKFNGVGVFHSRIQLLYFALLEGTACVSYYVPRPFTFNIGGHRYTPHFYVVEGAHRIIRELRSDGKFDEEWRSSLEKYCEFNSHKFEVIPTEWILEQEQLAENWLTITRMLARNIDHQTEPIERQILMDKLSPDGSTFGDLTQCNNANEKFFFELAVFRLLHQGKIKADLRYHPLRYETGMELCI